MWEIVGWQTVKGIHIENLFHLLIFSVDFFFEGVYNMRQVKTVGRSDSILFYFRLRRFGHEKNCISIDYFVFSRRLYG